MANIESKNLLVAVKAYARANPLPLDKDEVWESLSAAQTYLQSPSAYAGQTIKVLMDDGNIVHLYYAEGFNWNFHKLIHIFHKHTKTRCCLRTTEYRSYLEWHRV